MARLDYDQLDNFDLDNIKPGDILIWNSSTDEMVPASQVSFRRIFMLMGA